MWPMFLVDALAKGIQDTTAGAVAGAKEGQLAQQREEQMAQSRQEAAQKAQLFPYQLRTAATAAQKGEQLLPYEVRGAAADTALAEGTLQPKIDVAKMAPEEIRSKIAHNNALIEDLKAQAGQRNAETPWIAARNDATIKHLQAETQALTQAAYDKQFTREKQLEAANALADYIQSGNFKTGSLKDLMSNQGLFTIMGKYGPWLKDNQLLDAYLRMLAVTGSQDKVDVFGHMLKLDDQGLQEGKVDESRMFAPTTAGMAPTDSDARQWVYAHAKANVYRRFTGQASPVPPVPDAMREKLKTIYSAMAGPDRRPWYQFWGKPEVSETFLDKTIGYLQQGYSYEEAPVAAAKDMLAPKATAPAQGEGTTTPSYDIQILPDGTRKIIPRKP